MNDVLAARRLRRREPDPGLGALLFFSLIAASGFAFGWAAQALGSF